MIFNGEEAILFKTTFPRTPSGKIELESSYLARAYGRSLPTYQPVVSAYPLSLITPSSDQRTTSTFGNLKHSNEVWVDMNPQDAASRNLCDGMTVRVWNDQGEVHLPVRITETVRPGVVSSDKGAWFRTSANGQTVSALAPSHYADLSDGACYNDARVEAAALEDWQRQKPRGASLTHCFECGDEIPEKRRAAVSGCRLCIDCQRDLEGGRK